jgi:peptide deformylase
MVLPIYAFGQPVLKQEAIEIDPKSYPDLNILIENMWDTMKNAKGVGLAAPQIGLGIKLFVIDTTPYTKEEDEKFVPMKKVFINPVVLEETGTSWPFEEGCLSIPDIRADVERLATIKIAYIDEDGKEYEEVYSGLNARVIQHEYDHIMGVLFIDHLKPLKKRMLQRRLENIKKGQIECDYKVKFYRGLK